MLRGNGWKIAMWRGSPFAGGQLTALRVNEIAPLSSATWKRGVGPVGSGRNLDSTLNVVKCSQIMQRTHASAATRDQSASAVSICSGAPRETCSSPAKPLPSIEKVARRLAGRESGGALWRHDSRVSNPRSEADAGRWRASSRHGTARSGIRKMCMSSLKNCMALHAEKSGGQLTAVQQSSHSGQVN